MARTTRFRGGASRAPSARLTVARDGLRIRRRHSPCAHNLRLRCLGVEKQGDGLSTPGGTKGINDGSSASRVGEDDEYKNRTRIVKTAAAGANANAGTNDEEEVSVRARDFVGRARAVRVG